MRIERRIKEEEELNAREVKKEIKESDVRWRARWPRMRYMKESGSPPFEALAGSGSRSGASGGNAPPISCNFSASSFFLLQCLGNTHLSGCLFFASALLPLGRSPFLLLNCSFFWAVRYAVMERQRGSFHRLRIAVTHSDPSCD